MQHQDSTQFSKASFGTSVKERREALQGKLQIHNPQKPAPAPAPVPKTAQKPAMPTQRPPAPASLRVTVTVAPLSAPPFAPPAPPLPKAPPPPLPAAAAAAARPVVAKAPMPAPIMVLQFDAELKRKLAIEESAILAKKREARKSQPHLVGEEVSVIQRINDFMARYYDLNAKGENYKISELLFKFKNNRALSQTLRSQIQLLDAGLAEANKILLEAKNDSLEGIAWQALQKILNAATVVHETLTGQKSPESLSLLDLSQEMIENVKQIMMRQDLVRCTKGRIRPAP